MGALVPVLMILMFIDLTAAERWLATVAYTGSTTGSVIACRANDYGNYWQPPRTVGHKSESAGSTRLVPQTQVAVRRVAEECF